MHVTYFCLQLLQVTELENGPAVAKQSLKAWETAMETGPIPDIFHGNPAKMFYVTCAHFILVLKDTIVLY